MSGRLKIVDEKGGVTNAGLFDVCEWLDEAYPEDVFVPENGHPVSIMAKLARGVLAMRELSPYQRCGLTVKRKDKGRTYVHRKGKVYGRTMR